MSKMQKSGVKTLSIIDTLSELAHDETEASRLALPSPISVQRGSGNRLSSKTKQARSECTELTKIRMPKILDLMNIRN